MVQMLWVQTTTLEKLRGGIYEHQGRIMFLPEFFILSVSKLGLACVCVTNVTQKVINIDEIFRIARQ